MEDLKDDVFREEVFHAGDGVLGFTFGEFHGRTSTKPLAQRGEYRQRGQLVYTMRSALTHNE